MYLYRLDETTIDQRPKCSSSPHDTAHLFNCYNEPTDLTVKPMDGGGADNHEARANGRSFFVFFCLFLQKWYIKPKHCLYVNEITKLWANLQ